MNAVTRDDRIAVSIELAHGRVTRVEISARRPVGIGCVAKGKPADAIVALVPRLFALCAAAQGAAATLALSAARGAALAPDVLAAQASAVLAERLVELLRGTITTLAGDQLPIFASHLRNLIAAARCFDDRGLLDCGAIDALDRNLAALGLPKHSLDDLDTYRAWLASGSPLARLHGARAPSPRARGEGWREGAFPQGPAPVDRPQDLNFQDLNFQDLNFQDLDFQDSHFAAAAVDPLTVADDLAIGHQLLQHGAAFAARPDLAGRVPETGALARLADHSLIDSVGTGLAGRLLARLIEARATPRRLRALRRGHFDAADILQAASLCDGIGFGAVECARGRLHHLVALDQHGRITRYEILAPTEWNFHPQGPLARALSGAALTATEADRQRVAALVAALDPCVGFDVQLREVVDA